MGTNQSKEDIIKEVETHLKENELVKEVFFKVKRKPFNYEGTLIITTDRLLLFRNKNLSLEFDFE
jgi:RNA-binding protein YhbY